MASVDRLTLFARLGHACTVLIATYCVFAVSPWYMSGYGLDAVPAPQQPGPHWHGCHREVGWPFVWAQYRRQGREQLSDPPVLSFVLYFPFYPFALLAFIASLPPAVRAYRGRMGAVPWVVTAYGSGLALYATFIITLVKSINLEGWEELEHRVNDFLGVHNIPGVWAPVLDILVTVALVGVGVWYGFKAYCRAAEADGSTEAAPTTPPAGGEGSLTRPADR